ncbi:DUF4381 domain-containing protein [Pseudomonas sp. S9]|uniref:DUF4381 domain-containing protein n=1 Tax=Pseudomonas sp. S9 TaxID=686578 RepID=UPI00025573B7|nr:DUF4381 domain-containing protein [Pseudomonas sp. S9]
MTAPSTPNISQLQELPLPTPAFSYFPQTWGWLVLLLVSLLIFTTWAFLRWRRWLRNHYRREALLRLSQLQDASTDKDLRLGALRELPELLKRVALSMPNAPEVANLSGAQWQGFLQSTSPAPLPADLSQQLALLAYAPQAQLQALEPEQIDSLFSTCKQWIEAHHVAA